MRHLPFPLALAIVATAGALSAPASAVVLYKPLFNQAVSACQPALPAFDGLIRKRPKAVANEGASTAFVSCAMGFQPDDGERVRSLNVHFSNRSGSAQTFSCTVVDGFGSFNYGTSNTRAATAAAGGGARVSWTLNDNNGRGYTFPAVSCSLPPGTEIIAVTALVGDDVGA